MCVNLTRELDLEQKISHCASNSPRCKQCNWPYLLTQVPECLSHSKTPHANLNMEKSVLRDDVLCSPKARYLNQSLSLLTWLDNIEQSRSNINDYQKSFEYLCAFFFWLMSDLHIQWLFHYIWLQCECTVGYMGPNKNTNMPMILSFPIPIQT